MNNEAFLRIMDIITHLWNVFLILAYCFFTYAGFEDIVRYLRTRNSRYGNIFMYWLATNALIVLFTVLFITLGLV